MLHAPVVTRDISVVTKRGRSMSPAAQAFLEVIQAELGAAAH
jgi:DNA-binding transcriptional LysR family regulator